MRRGFLYLALVLSVIFCTNAFARDVSDIMDNIGSLIDETNAKPPEYAVTADNVSDATIFFRGLEWYSEYDEVHSLLLQDCEPSILPFFCFENTTIDSIYRIEWAYMFSDDRVEEAGVNVCYNDISVAGYIADAEVYYMYPIKNGKVDRSLEGAQMYVAYYVFEDMADLPAVYDDLSIKLTSLYGEGTPKSNGYYNGIYWQDSHGNMAWLLIENDNSAVRLGYAAGDHIARLGTLRDQIRSETIAAEDESRQDNAGNTSGL